MGPARPVLLPGGLRSSGAPQQVVHLEGRHFRWPGCPFQGRERRQRRAIPKGVLLVMSRVMSYKLYDIVIHIKVKVNI